MADDTNTAEREAFRKWAEQERAAGCFGDMERGWLARASLTASSGSEPVAWMDSERGEVVSAKWLASDEATSDYRVVYTTPLYTHPSPPEGMAGWKPIATAPEGQMVVVGWLDPEDPETPERHDFDLLEDGCWQKWHDHAEHVHIIGGHGVSYTPPYTCWLPVPPLPASEAKEL